MGRVLKAEGILVLRFPFAGRLQEMIVGNRIGIQSTIRDPRRINELLAHALGHYFLHAGNQPFYHFQREPIVAQQWERQAWDFAFELLMPASHLERWLKRSWDEVDLREHFQVSEEFFHERMEILREANTASGEHDSLAIIEM
jgi:Zn-dependent peptidase ImmA (M78 family)